MVKSNATKKTAESQKAKKNPQSPMIQQITGSNDVVRGGLELPTHGFSIHHRQNDSTNKNRDLLAFPGSEKSCLTEGLTKNWDTELQMWLEACPIELSEEAKVQIISLVVQH